MPERINLTANPDVVHVCELTLSAPDNAPGVERQARVALIDHLPSLSDLGIPVEFHRIAFRVPPHLSLCNPSIAWDQNREGYRAVVRAVNYSFANDVGYVIHGHNGFRTVNYLVDLDREFWTTRIRRLSDEHYHQPGQKFPITSFEDLRLVRFRHGWWAVGAYADFNNPAIWSSELVRLKSGRLTNRRALSSPSEASAEKNWMPVEQRRSGALRIVRSCSPTTVVSFDPESGILRAESSHEAPLIARSLRGGTQVIPFEDGFLCVVHDHVVRDGEWMRTYFHRWLWFTSEWKIGLISSPFYFRHHGVEFAAGLLRDGDSFIVSFGVHDQEAWLARIPVESVRSLLHLPIAPLAARRQLRRIKWRSDGHS